MRSGGFAFEIFGILFVESKEKCIEIEKYFGFSLSGFKSLNQANFKTAFKAYFWASELTSSYLVNKAFRPLDTTP